MQKYATEGLQGYTEYFNYFKTLKEEGFNCGDSNSFPMSIFGNKDQSNELKTLSDVDHIHILIRNGIRTVNSVTHHNLTTTSYLDLLTRTTWLTETINRINELQKSSQGEFRFSSFVPDEELAKMKTVSTNLNQYSIQHIYETLAPLLYLDAMISWGKLSCDAENMNNIKEIWKDKFFIWKLEDLTEDTESIRKLLQLYDIEYSDAELTALQKNDVNKKVNTKDIETILRGWDVRYLQWFKEICGETMKYHNYDMDILEDMV